MANIVRGIFLSLAWLGIAAGGSLIGDVRVDRNSFAPINKDAVKLRYRLAKPASVTVKVWDPDRELVRTLAALSRRTGGLQTETWDGKDAKGRVVPNEAYFFTIEAEASAGDADVYDPETTTGGEFGDITKGAVSRASGTLMYELSQPSRVLARAGVPGSSLLKTIVDWEPRAAGAVTEYWNGKDEDNVLDVLSLKHTIIVSYMTLTENSVIAYGNTALTYRAYKTAGGVREKKPIRPFANSRMVSPHFQKTRTADRGFSVKIGFPEADKAAPQPVPVAKDRLLVRLEIDPKDQMVLEGQQYEIILFVDSVFQSEEERGYLPFNYPVELKQVPPGEHVITANIITFGDQIGIGSRKIRVAR